MKNNIDSNAITLNALQKTPAKEFGDIARIQYGLKNTNAKRSKRQSFIHSRKDSKGDINEK